MNSLFDSEPVKVLEMLGDMRTGMEVEDSTKCKVLYSLKLGNVGYRDIEEKRVTLIKFGGNDIVDKSSYSVRGMVFSDSSDILQDYKRRNSFGDLKVKR